VANKYLNLFYSFVNVSTNWPIKNATSAQAPPRKRVSIPQRIQCEVLKLLLTHPKINNTMPVTMQEVTKRILSSKSGKLAGIIT